MPRSFWETYFSCPQLQLNGDETGLPIRDVINFIGAGGAVADDPVNEVTNVTLGAGGSSVGPTMTFASGGAQNNLATLSGGTPADVILFTFAGTVTLNGLASGTESRRIRLVPATSSTVLQLVHLSGSAPGGSKIKLPDGTASPFTVPANSAACLVYDSVNAVWRLEPITSVGGSNKQLLWNNAGAIAGESEWTREATGRFNATLLASLTYGAAGDTFPSAGFLRVSSPGGSGTYKPYLVYKGEDGNDVHALSFYENGPGVAPDILIGGRFDQTTEVPSDVAIWGNSILYFADHEASGMSDSEVFEHVERLIQNTLNAAPIVGAFYTIQGSILYEFEIKIRASSSGGNFASWEFKIALTGGGVPVILDSSDTSPIRHRFSAGASAWNVTLTTSASRLNVNITGAAVTSIDWIIRAEWIEVA
jgi:hypothetical protein